MDEPTAKLISEIRSSPPGTFKRFRAIDEQPAVKRSMDNQAQLAVRINHAKASYCLVEVISLRIQYLDLWLRIFFENTPHKAKRRRQFGHLLDQCLSQGLEKSLYERLSKFNQNRIAAIHGFVLGSITYAEMAGVVQESEGLAEALVGFVLTNSGEMVTDTEDFESQHHNRGDMVFHLPRAIQLRAGHLI